MPTQEEIDKIVESTDMVELVSPYVKLSKQGKNIQLIVLAVERVGILFVF